MYAILNDVLFFRISHFSKSKETKGTGATSLNVGGVANARFANGAKGPTEYGTSYNRDRAGKSAVM